MWAGSKGTGPADGIRWSEDSSESGAIGMKRTGWKGPPAGLSSSVVISIDRRDVYNTVDESNPTDLYASILVNYVSYIFYHHKKKIE